MTAVGQFCWVDLAATDAVRAKDFYARVFDWTVHDHRANGGLFTRLQCGGRDIGSLYQMARLPLERGVPSHWTPYVRIADMDAVTQAVQAGGGEVIVKPFVVSGVARIALVSDAVGAQIGLWGDIA